MTDQNSIFVGGFQEGMSSLHQLDPRLKLVLCLVLVVSTFAAANGWRFGAAALATAALVWSGHGLNVSLLRAIFRFRWFFLVTLLLHLLLSPGYTLFGVAWLSRDGLLTGLLVCGQMVVAICCSTLLGQTTSPQQLARACGWFLTPFRWLGCRVDEWEEILLLSLTFLPTLGEEIAATAPAESDAASRVELKGVSSKLRHWNERLTQVLERLVLRADQMASEIANGEHTLTHPATLPPLWPITLAGQLYGVSLLVFLAVYGLAGWL